MNLSLTWYVRSTIVCFAVLMITGAQAQVPDYDPFLTEREKDSLATAEYPYIFPLFGKDVVRKGFELPLPVGINIKMHEYADYYKHIRDSVVTSWRARYSHDLTDLFRKSAKVSILFRVNRDGSITGVRPQQGQTADLQVTSKLLEVIRNAGPLDKFPDKISEPFLNVRFTFCY